MASEDKLKELNLSSDELQRLQKAFKDEEFRKLFVEYAEEISDPENRKRYEAEIAEMEAERGTDIKFINPEPGYVVKTSMNGESKAFVNICKNANVKPPSSSKQRGSDGKVGLQWSIPHSFAPPREDVDKSGNKCQVYDVVFHPDTYRMAESNARFKKMLHDTAFDGIERQFDVKLDRKNLKFPKMKFKGTPTATVIRTRKEGGPTNESDPDDIMKDFPYPYDNMTTEEKTKMREEKIARKVKDVKTKITNGAGKPSVSGDSEQKNTESEYATPNYTITHRSEHDIQEYRNAPDARTSTRPKEIVIGIDLPLLKSAAPVNLDIFEKGLKLESSKPAAYKLDLALPYPVNENEGSAKFDKSKRRLVITLPVVPAVMPSLPFINGGGDAGVDNAFTGTKQQDDENANVTEDSKDSLDMDRKPRIEVLSSQDNVEHAVGTNQQENKKENPTASTSPRQELQEKEIWSNADIETPKAEPKVKYSFPEYNFRQDLDTVTFVLLVKNIAKDSVTKIFSEHSSSFQVKFVSIGSGGFPLHYSFVVKFEEGCTIQAQTCAADISDENLVLVLVKDEASKGLWAKFQAGMDNANLQEKLFLTEDNLQAELQQLEANQMPAARKLLQGSQVHVTEMNEEKLTIKISPKSSSEDAEFVDSSPEIEVIHEKGLPKLQGILKQRGRTMSESSDDVFSNSFSRENSITSHNSSESPISESDENFDGERKKSVSFCEHVDKTTYKTASSVSAMRATLKNKRRRARKREQKQEKSRRRRHNSGGSEHSSSGDELSSQQEESEGTASADASDELRDEDVMLEPAVTQDEAPRTKKSETSVSETKTVPGKKGDNVRTKNKKAKAGEAGKHSGACNGSVPAGTAGSAPGALVSGKMEAQEGCVGDDDDDDDDDSDAETSPKVISEVPVSGSKSHSQTNEGGETRTDVKEGSETKNVLSWKDKGDVSDPLANEHRTACAFEFTNTMIYDLDED